jgi:hypothetical protein
MPALDNSPRDSTSNRRPVSMRSSRIDTRRLSRVESTNFLPIDWRPMPRMGSILNKPNPSSFPIYALRTKLESTNRAP